MDEGFSPIKPKKQSDFAKQVVKNSPIKNKKKT
jgi:hypothetical protein